MDNRTLLKQFYAKRKRTRAVSTKVDDIRFPSQLEASVYCLLKLMVKSGDYENLRVHPKINMVGDLNWNIDFLIFNKTRGVDEAHEVKGIEFERYRAQVQAWSGCMNIDLFIWKGTADNPRMVKIIRGKND